MKLRKLMIAGCVSMLAAACASTASVDGQPVVELATPAAQPSAQAAAPCADPVSIPHRAISAGEVQRLWGRDRVALTACGQAKADLAEFYRDRDARLAGAPPQ
jgi:hypothetical protein